MYRVKMCVLGLEMEFEAADQKELWKRVALFDGAAVQVEIAEEIR